MRRDFTIRHSLFATMAEPTLKTRTIIGLEIHVQLQTRTKMFCSCPVTFDAPPNSCVCPVCLGHPGSLPVINRRAFTYAVLTGLALNCKIARHTKWDRKNYYYPDLPKNYQISQYDLPLAQKGCFEIPVNGGTKRIRIRRAHLEEDAGKNIHDVPGCTLVDLNRAGTPLLEIVTEPDLSSADEAYIFCTELQRLVTYLGVSEGVMKKGQMRFEPNVNVAIDSDGQEYRTPIAEIKNLNSFRAVRDAIAYETKRQVVAWKEDHGYQLGIKPNENRGWNSDKGITEYQREKEAAHDYRYFPDPDLVPVEITDAMLDEVRARLPELPIARRDRFVSEFSLSAKDAETIVGHRATADLFEKVLAQVASPLDHPPLTKGGQGGVDPLTDVAPPLADSHDVAPPLVGSDLRRVRSADLNADVSRVRCADLDRDVSLSRIKIVTKQFLNVWLRLANERNVHVTDLGVNADQMAELAKITADGTVSKTAANRLAQIMLERSEPHESPSPLTKGGSRGVAAPADAERTTPSPLTKGGPRGVQPPIPSPLQLAKELGLIQTQDTAATQAWVDQAFAENEKAVQDALKHPKKAKAATGFLRGQVMKISGGKADPKLVGKLIEQHLKETR